MEKVEIGKFREMKGFRLNKLAKELNVNGISGVPGENRTQTGRIDKYEERGFPGRGQGGSCSGRVGAGKSGSQRRKRGARGPKWGHGEAGPETQVPWGGGRVGSGRVPSVRGRELWRTSRRRGARWQGRGGR